MHVQQLALTTSRRYPRAHRAQHPRPDPSHRCFITPARPTPHSPRLHRATLGLVARTRALGLSPWSADQPSRWHWDKTTTCDPAGHCVDHYNPTPTISDRGWASSPPASSATGSTQPSATWQPTPWDPPYRTATLGHDRAPTVNHRDHHKLGKVWPVRRASRARRRASHPSNQHLGVGGHSLVHAGQRAAR